MPLAAVFLLMMGAGGFLVYAAVKGEHPWSLFSQTLSASSAPGTVPGPGQTGFGAVAPGVTVTSTGVVAH